MRRANSKPKPLWLVLLTLLTLGVAGLGYWIFSNLQDPYRTLQPLDLGSYLENSDNLRGNVYKLDGTIQSALAWSAVEGRLFSIEIQNSKGNKEFVGVLIPVELGEVNLQKGQRYAMKVEVRHDGILKVLELRKS
ncbi:MAG: hypothetical protein HC904_00195 [Blastochloris sp.]|nr:hypothetical protein [Blastochloris sp.]